MNRVLHCPVKKYVRCQQRLLLLFLHEQYVLQYCQHDLQLYSDVIQRCVQRYLHCAMQLCLHVDFEPRCVSQQRVIVSPDCVQHL
jgi:hypothetical protein